MESAFSTEFDGQFPATYGSALELESTSHSALSWVPSSVAMADPFSLSLSHTHACFHRVPCVGVLAVLLGKNEGPTEVSIL